MAIVADKAAAEGVSTMVRPNEFDFAARFERRVDWMRKDLRICREEAARNGAPLPVTEIVAGFYDELVNSPPKWAMGRSATQADLLVADGEERHLRPEASIGATHPG